MLAVVLLVVEGLVGRLGLGLLCRLLAGGSGLRVQVLVDHAVVVVAGRRARRVAGISAAGFSGTGTGLVVLLLDRLRVAGPQIDGELKLLPALGPNRCLNYNYTITSTITFCNYNYLRILAEFPVLPHELHDGDEAGDNHSTKEDNENSAEIWQTKLSAVRSSSTL